jgi:two-component system, OmpR family, response regulator
MAKTNGREIGGFMKDTVLIVDDSTFIVEGLVALLKKTYLPVPSYSGPECLSLLRTLKPSLIILDIMMEPMDGWETLAQIKENPATRHIPVLMFSAKKISPAEAENHRIIIDDFITKPVNPKKLIEAIGRVLARQEFNRQILRSWNSAGVNPEIIDEYLSQKTNLDVDVSLLAVMEKQLDTAYPDALNRDELISSVVALEERIRESRARIEAFCRERAGDLPAPDRDNPPLSYLEPESEPTTQPSEGISRAEDVPPAPDTAPYLVPVTETIPEPAPVSADLFEEKPQEEEQNTAIPTHQTHSDSEGENATDLPGSDLLDLMEEPVPPSRMEPGTDNTPNRSVSPSKPQKDRNESAASPPGAGTQTPHMRSGETAHKVQKWEMEKREERRSRESAPAPTGGIISRIIAAITALFGKKGQ